MLRVPFSLFIVLFFVQFGNAQCPEISTISFDPDLGTSLCPGETVTIDLTGMNLPQGTIDWYLEPGDDDFNPYEGEGIPIGASVITPDEEVVELCEPCPSLLAIMIDACNGNGSEKDNEFLVISSGGGIGQAGDIQINFDEQNNFEPSGTNVNNDINLGNAPCGFLNFPNINLMQNLQSTMDCGFDNIIGIGPNDPIPAGALVVVFTSSTWNLAYDFNGLCANGETIYILQNNCNRERPAFSNVTSSGCRNTFVTIDGCDCQSNINYNTDNTSNEQITSSYVYVDDVNGNGEIDYTFGGCNSNEIIHTNGVPCVAPPVESVPIPTVPSVIESFEYTIPLNFCDEFGTGTYSIVGAINPLSEECAGGGLFGGGNTEDFLTQTYTFVTTCQQPDLENPADLCIGESIVLNDLVNDIDQYSNTGWYDNQDPFAGNEVTNFMATDEGDFTYYFFPTGAGGDCYSSGNVTITVTTGTSFVLDTDMICQSETAYDLTNLEDPSFSDGTWILNGSAVVGDMFDATGFSGDVELTFEPANPDNSSCLSPQTTTLTVTNGPSLSPSTSNDLGCTDNTATLNSGANGSGFTYQWSGDGINGMNETDAEPSVDQAGMYSVTVTNTTTGCQSIEMVELMQNSTGLPDVDAQVSSVITCTAESIMLDGISNDATSFSWTAPDGTIFDDEDPMVSDTGVYTLTVTDIAGCTATTTLFVDADTIAPNIDILLSNDLNCNNPTATIFGNSPEEDLTDFEWIYNGSSISDEQNLMGIEAGGSYTLIVTDMNGCTNTDQVSVAIDTTSPEAVINENIDVLTCAQMTVALDALGSSPDVGFNWETPTSTIIGPTPEVSDPGIYTLTVSAFNGCTDTASIEVIELINPPSIELEADTLDCSGSMVGIASMSPEMITNYAWSGPDSYFSSDANPSNIVVSGPYSVTVTASNGCTNEATAIVETDDDVPTAQIDTLLSTVINCIDTNLPFEVSNISPNSTIEWTFPNATTSNDLLINVVAEGNYGLMITGDNGCSSALSIAVTEDTTIPTLQVFPTGELNCTNDASFLVNSNAADIVWILPDATIQTGTNFETTEAGLYTVTATGENGCVNSEMIDVVANNDPPSIDAIESGDLTCTNNEAQLTASSTMSNVIFSWETPNGGETLIGADQTVAVAGEYTLVVTNLNNNCTSTATTTVAPAADAPDALIASNGGTALDCDTENVELVGSSTTVGVMYEWTAPDNTTFSTATIDANQVGTYTLTVINNDCTTTETIALSLDNEAPQNVVADSGTIFCDPDSVVLNVSSDNVADSFEWFDPNGISVSTSSTATAFGEGMYSVVATATNGCTSTATAEVIENETEPTIIATGTTLDCGGTAFNLIGSSDDTVTYTWTDEDGNPFSDEQNPNVSETGIYTLIVTDTQTGCTNSATAEVMGATDIPSIAIDNMTPMIDCNSTSVELTANSDANDAIFEWVDAAGMTVSNNAILENAAIGTYTVQVTTDSGCSNTQSVEVQDASVQPEVQIDTTTTVLDCDNQSIVLTANSNVATPNYEWQNDNGDILSTDIEYTTTEIGNITLVVFDGNCSNSTSQLITSDGSAPMINVAITSTENIIDCNTDNVELTGISMNNVSYNWSGPDDFEATTAVIQADNAGDYVLIITDLDNACTNVSTTTIFDDFAQPAIEADGGIIDCVSNGTTLSASTPIPSSSYEWTLNEVFVSDEANPFVSQQGTYTLVVTSPTNGCSDTTTALVTLDTDFPELSAVTESITCINTVTFLDASASSPINNDVTYQWSLNDVPVGTNEITPSVTAAGIYQLIGTNTTNQCADTLLLEVTENTSNPTAVAGDDTEINCVMSTVTLDGTASTGQGNLSYQWLTFTGDEISQDSMVEVDTGMPYTLIVTDNLNGCTATTEVEVIDNILEPQAAIASTGMIDCNQTMVELDANGSLGSADLDYQWLDVNGVEIGTEAIQFIDTGGVYTLVLTNNENGCTDSMPITITEDTLTPNIVFATPSILTCTNTEVVLDALGSDDNTDFTIEWTGPMGAAISDVNSLNPTVTQLGNYILTIQNPNNGCANSETLTIGEDIETPLAVAATSDELGCDINSVQLLGIGSSQGTIFSYEWSGMSITSENDLLNAETDAAGIYTLIVTNDINGCTEIASTEVIQNEEGIENSLVDFDNESCFGDANGTISITEVVGGAAPYMYGINGENLTNVPDFSNLTPGVYPIVVEDIDGCQWTDSVTIEAAIPITVELGENILAQAGEIIDLDVLTNAIIDTIIWSESTLEGTNPSFAPVTNTTINVTVVDENGCTETDAITIFIEEGSSVYIPNAFSPNADGVNDVLKIYGNEAVQSVLNFQIFDRWGTLVYEAKDFQLTDAQNEWDGFYKNKALDSAVFVFFAEIELTSGSTEIYKGDITLMR